jgi:putative sugar O-methyltransferase
MEAILLRDFPQAACHFNSFVEPEISRPDQTMVYKGRRISSPLLAHMLFYFSCATRVPDMDCVCEIGGGFGAPARLFLTNSFRRPSTYVIVDLPESLYFAELYLHATLGGDRVQYVQPGARLDLTDGGVILCPVGRLSTLKSIRFDLVLNMLSAQEMTDEYVAFYRNWLDEQHASYFYSFNYLMQSVFETALFVRSCPGQADKPIEHR